LALINNAGPEGPPLEGFGRWWAAPDPTFTVFTDPALYQAAVGDQEIISFTEDVVSPGEILFAQYVDVGVVFADGEITGGGDDDVVMVDGSFVSDGVGVNPNGTMEIEFLAPQTHMGVDFPGGLRVELFSGPDLVWSSAGDLGGTGTGFFAGVVASEGSFDRAVLSDPVDGFAFVDDLRYDRIPEPGTFLVLGTGGLALLVWRKRKRRAG